VEAKRWNPNVGHSLKLAVSGSRLAIASEGSSKVLLFDLRTMKKIAETASPTPTQIAFNGNTIVTYDGVGQRMMRYKVMEK